MKPPKQFRRSNQQRARSKDRAFLFDCHSANFVNEVVPAKALEHAHIFEAPSDSDSVEVFEAVLQGDGAWRFGGGIAVPAAKAADDPGGPGEAVGRMRVPKPFTLGFEILIEGGECGDLVGIEGKPDGLMTTAVARLQKLDGDDCRLGSDRDQLEESIGGSDLAV